MTTRLNPSGFLVLDVCDNWGQMLSLDLGKDKPPGGVLCWPDRKHMRAIFPTRRAARAAITRTEHYRKAYGHTDIPEAKNCSIELVALVEQLEPPTPTQRT